MKKIKVFSVCSGVGGLDMPFSHDDRFEVIGFSEIDRHASAVLKHHYPKVKNYGDLTQIRLEELPDFDLLVGGTPCFVKGTLVTTRRGHIPIEEVRIGDSVLTHRGRWKKVLDIGFKHNAPTREIRGMGFLDTRTTDEHPYFCSEKGREWNNEKRIYDRKFSDLDWVKAKDIIAGKHFASQVLPQEENIEGDSDFWWVVGRYVADGWLRNRKDRNNGREPDYVLICCGKHEKNELKERIFRKFNASVSEERTTFKFQIANKKFAKFLEDFGRGAENKEFPPKYYGISSEQAKAFLEGYYSGDGYYDGKKFGSSTVSAKLTIGLSVLIQKAHGVISSIHKSETPNTKIIEGRLINQKDFYQVNYRPKGRKSEYFITDKYGLKPIRKNEPTNARETVYNIEVEEDNSYIANGCIVHNCQNFSVAGKREGLAGAKSRLFYTYAEILKVKRPDYFVWENVKGTFSSNAGWDFAQVQIELAEAGYSFRWELLNSKEFGVPQNRERVLVVGCSGRKRGREILSQPRNLRTDSTSQSDDESGEEIFIATKFLGRNGKLTSKDCPTIQTSDLPHIKDNVIKKIYDKTSNGKKSQCASVYDITGIFPSVTAGTHGYSMGQIAEDKELLAWSSSGRDWGREERVTKNHAHTLNTGDGCRTQSACNYVANKDEENIRIRKLTPLECERLMGWPDGWTQYGNYEGEIKEMSNTQRYKQCGNGVVPQCIEPIKNLILEMESL